jgi:hypothetical protein
MELVTRFFRSLRVGYRAFVQVLRDGSRDFAAGLGNLDVTKKSERK